MTAGISSFLPKKEMKIHQRERDDLERIRHGVNKNEIAGGKIFFSPVIKPYMEYGKDTHYV